MSAPLVATPSTRSLPSPVANPDISPSPVSALGIQLSSLDYSSADQHAYIRSIIAHIPSHQQPHLRDAVDRVFCKTLPDDISFPVIDLYSLGYGPPRTPKMVHVDLSAPSSPPDLSFSKSSKSSNSSYRSPSPSESTSSDLGKLAHFEEVALEEHAEDNIEDCNVKPESRPTLRRHSPRPGTLPDGRRPSGSLASPPPPPLSSRSPPPPVSRDFLPAAPHMRRVFTSPSSPQLSLSPSMKPASRSPSPKSASYAQGSHATSPQPRASWDRPQFPHQRRLSWQPGRKSIKELEAECNDDDDGEVPDDAILENVPISPVPGMPSMFPRRATMSSPNLAPQRRPSHTSSLSAHGNLHSAKVPKNAKRPSGPTIMPNGQYGAPRSPRHSRPPMMPHSATTGAFPPELLSHKHRSKSWSEDLSEEARQLSAALEEYAERTSTEKRDSAHSYTSKGSSDSPRPELAKTRAKTMVTELPPVQKGNIMIDPLPISKEKEAVLTRTRPSWLPPKDKKEEKKHLKEWQAMMNRAQEMERKRASREKEEMEIKEEMQGSIARVWEKHVLPHWDDAIKEPRTRELWWRGVHPPCRAEVWRLAIGNELGLTPNSFQAALQRANEAEEKVAEMPDEERGRSKEAAWLDAIARDVPNVIRDQPVYKGGTPLHKALTDVLKAYAMYRSDVGYVYGIHLVAGTLCLNLPPADAFIVLANVMNRPIPLAFLVHDQAAMARTYDLVLGTLKYKFSKLHDHLTSPSTHIKAEEYLDPMFRCLFGYNLSPEHVNRIWDIFVFEGDKALIRAAVAVLGKLEGKLYGSRQEVLDLISWRNDSSWPVGNEEDFIKAMREAGKVDANGDSIS